MSGWARLLRQTQGLPTACARLSVSHTALLAGVLVGLAEKRIID